jgi:hypothetical protein
MIGNIEAGVRELLEDFLNEVPGDPLAPLQLDEHKDDIVIELEERFGISLGAEEPDLRSVSAIVALVTQKQRKRAT